MMRKEDKLEFIGQLIDIFEDFLEEKGIAIPNIDKEDDTDLDKESAAIIYGEDYYSLESKIEDTLVNWKMFSNFNDTLDSFLEKIKKHSQSIIKNNGWEDIEYRIDCRDYEEGYLQAIEDIRTFHRLNSELLHIVNELNCAIDEGYIERDPSNKENIIVYRLASETSPEGWYSENLMNIASELLNDAEQYDEFKKALMEVRKEGKTNEEL